MKIIKLFVLICFLASGCSEHESQFKEDVLTGYEKRCKEVLASKEYSDSEIESECSCEVEVVRADFSTFELMVINAKKVSGSSEPMSKKAVENLKKKLRSCKIRAPGSAAS